MGVERVAFLLQGVDNVYETDLLRPVIDTVSARAPRGYAVGNHEDDVRYRIIADHSRTAAILIGDGVSPGNDGRGYVLRRLLRRVIRSAKLLGIDTPIVGDLMTTVRDAMGPSYPELVNDFDRIHRIAVAEETAFNRTLASGSRLFEEAARATKASGTTVLSGTDAFTLHDTYGFPLELTLEMAAEAGLSVDEEGFRGLMAEQRQRAKADAAARKQAHSRPVRLSRARRRRSHRVHRFRRIDLRGNDSRHLRRRQAGAGGDAHRQRRFRRIGPVATNRPTVSS